MAKVQIQVLGQFVLLRLQEAPGDLPTSLAWLSRGEAWELSRELRRALLGDDDAGDGQS